MKRVLILVLMALPLFVVAQNLKLGYLSHSEVLQKMPEYAEAQKNVTELRQQYEQEAQRSEAEFQRRFQDFMEGQKDFPKTILQKRQSELQTMLEANVKFRIQVQKLLAEAEENLLKDVKTLLNEAISTVAERNGYILIINTDDDSVPFISPSIGTDVTSLVKAQLGIKESTADSSTAIEK